MKFPYIKLVETLIVGRIPAEQVVNECANLGFQFPLEAVFHCEAMLYKDNEEYFSSKDAPDPIWIHELGLEKLFGHRFQVQLPMGVVGIEGAYKIINDPLMFRLITSMALANATEEDIELIVNGKYNIEYATEDIVEFLHYFFNVKKWTIADKQQYINTVTVPELKSAYKLALKGDKDYLLWKLGAAPEKPFDAMLKDMMVDSYYNFKERAKADPELAQKWGTLAVKLTDRLEKLEKETHEKQDMFADIQFQIKDNAMPSEFDSGPLDGASVNVKVSTIPRLEDLK